MKKSLQDCTIALVGPIETDNYLHILHLPAGAAYPKGLGGSPVNLLALELHKRGYKLLLCTEDPGITEDVCLEGERLKIRFVPCGPRPARSFFRREIRGMARVLLEEQPDFIHAHWTYEFALAAEATRIPHLITAHDAPLNVLRYNFIPFRIARTLMAYAAVARARNLSAVSPYVVEHLRNYLFYRRPIRVITNGMPDWVFNRQRPPRSATAPPVFATILVGWSGRKNGEAALRAFALVSSRRADARLLMFGDCHGPGQEAERWARQHELHHGVEFAGHLPYQQLIARLCNEVDVLIHPALEESQGMVLIEAMAMGIPVIGGKDSGAVPWTLDYGAAGMLVDVTRPETMAAAMQHLADDPEARRRLGAAGLGHARNTFHIGVVADAYVDCYRRILERAGA